MALNTTLRIAGAAACALALGGCPDATPGSNTGTDTDGTSGGEDDETASIEHDETSSTPVTSTTTDATTTVEPVTGSESGSEGGTDDTGIPPTSPGCGLPFNTDWYEPYVSPGGEMTNRAQVEAAGVTREFLIELPENYDPDTAYPVVWTFHGLGAEMSNAFGQHIERLWDHQVVAIYPQGLENTWDTSTAGADIPMFTAVLNEVGTQMCLDMQAIYVQGTSMGGGMSNFVACALGDLVAGSGPTASWFPIAADQCVGPVPQFVIHGMNDGTVSFNSGVETRDIWLSINGCENDSVPVDPAPCMSYDNCTSGAPVVWCPHDGGHDLPNVQGLDDDMQTFFRSL